LDLLFPRESEGQVHFVCPLPNAILQKVSDSGYMRLTLTSPSSSKIRLRLIGNTGVEISGYGWKDFILRNNTLDTFYMVPVLNNFYLEWQTLDGMIDSNVIGNLCIGHVFGIAGQSNAQGWSFPTYIPPQGNIRMLLYSDSWQKGEDPTGGKSASPWIQMSNTLQKLLNDSLPIGLVNVAIGGTGLVSKPAAGWWQRNNSLHLDTSTIYGKAVERFQRAGSHFEAIFWIQGESDAIGVTGAQYDSAFKRLVEDFEEDLQEPVTMLHLQIGGQAANPEKIDWGIIREAQRKLPLSTLVGTAVGAPLGFDAIHYAQSTEIMVGDRFAGAVAKLLHHVPNNFYPLLLPQNAASLVECNSQDPYNGYKIALQCSRGDLPVELKVSDALKGFQIRANGRFIDTSKIFAKVELSDLSKIDIFSTVSSLAPSSELKLSYALTADLANANVCDNDSTTVLPNYLVSFMDIPVLGSNAGVPDVTIIFPNISNPVLEESMFVIHLKKIAAVNYSVYDMAGKMVYSKDAGLLSEGSHAIQINRGPLTCGVYEVVVAIGSERRFFKIIIL